jgi:hypothetical protein
VDTANVAIEVEDLGLVPYLDGITLQASAVAERTSGSAFAALIRWVSSGDES